MEAPHPHFVLLEKEQEQWILWQLSDSAFPSGSFSHSGGLEAVHQHLEVRSGGDLTFFLRSALAQSARSQVPFLNSAFENSESFQRIDWRLDAFTSNHVANRASRRQGRAFLQGVQKTFPSDSLDCLVAETETAPRHLATVFGAVCRCLGLGKTAAQNLFFFSQLRCWVSSAVRLGIVGPFEAQRIQAGMYGEIGRLQKKVYSLDYHQAAQTFPLLDMLQGTHDRLYSRLFQS